MLQGEVAVGHAGNVVAEAALEAVAADAGFGFAAEQGRLGSERVEELGNHPGRLAVGGGDLGMAVEVFEEKPAQGGELAPDLRAEGGEAGGMVSDVGARGHAAAGEVGGCLRDEILHEIVDEAADDESPVPVRAGARILPAGAVERPHPERDGFQRCRLQESGIQAVIQVVAGVGDLVRQIRHLGFQRWGGIPLPGQGMDIPVGVLLNSLAHIPGEVEPASHGVFFFDDLDDPQALGVVVKPPMAPHQPVQLLLPGVAAGRMAEIVGQGDRLGQILVQPQRAGGGAADRGHLDRVREAGSVVVAGPVEKHLGFSIQPPEGRAVDDSRPVALDLGAKRMAGLPVGASGRAAGRHGQQGWRRDVRQRWGFAGRLAHIRRGSVDSKAGVRVEQMHLAGLDFEPQPVSGFPLID